jgi:uncharacterized membrane protein YgdD (TMEM256/DUF423 family)
LDRAFLILGSGLAFLGVALGAFGSHALRARLTAERLATFETGVRYQLWHALALFAVVFVRSVQPVGSVSATYMIPSSENLFGAVAGWLFVAGIVLFSGSLYALAVTGVRRWGAVTPFGGLCFLLGWLALALAAITI